MNTLTHSLILSLFFSLLFPFSTSSLHKPPPLPLLPIPTHRQLRWQLSPMSMFFHFGPNTYTDSEWGSGRADPSVFYPEKLNTTQWIKVAKDSGFNRVIITAKHHDGFCLWPTRYTEYSVKSSSWRNGGGDVVKEIGLSAKEFGVDLGVYLSPWDKHEECFGKTLDYNEHYLGQMTELLTWYGEIKDVFLDGAKGEGEKDMYYFFDRWFSLIHQYQPEAIIFSDAGPDTRWIGDEDGVGGSTCWSIFNRSNVRIGGSNDPIYAQGGDPSGLDWVPATCDVSIRPGWFWHASEAPKSAIELLDIYYKTAGRNCLFLLNVPPNLSGLIADEDVQVLQEFAEIRRSIFSRNLAENAITSASSVRGGARDSPFDPYNVLTDDIYTYWAPEENQSTSELRINLQEPVAFNVLQVQEPIHMGQRIIAFHLEILNEAGNWRTVANGSTVGYQRLLRFPTVESQHLKFVIDKSRADPLVSHLGIYKDKFSIVKNIFDVASHTHLNSSKALLKQKTQNHSQIWTM